MFVRTDDIIEVGKICVRVICNVYAKLYNGFDDKKSIIATLASDRDPVYKKLMWRNSVDFPVRKQEDCQRDEQNMDTIILPELPEPRSKSLR